MITKSILRSCAFKYRSILDVSTFEHRNESLLAQVEEYLISVNAFCIHTFLAIGKNNEPDLSPIFSKFWQNDIRIVVSKTEFESHSLTHYYLDPDTDLTLGKFDIPEPVHAEAARLEDVEVLFIPLLLADKAGNRIGYGAGYYDQLLSQTKAKKVGISLTSPVDRISQTDEWDRPMDVLITPFKIYSF